MNTPRPLIFGEVLFDRFPGGESVLGGAPFNVAWNLRALGADPLLVTRVGDDEAGAQVLDRMEAWGLSTAGVQRDAARPTGQVVVTLEDSEPRFEIREDQAYDHIAAAELPELGGEHLLCHGTLARRSPASRETLEELRRRSGAARVVDVNLRPPFWERGDVLELCRGARVVKLNEHELEALVPEAADLDGRARGLLATTGAERLLLTRGAAGATLRGADGRRAEASPRGGGPFVDSVGAGDAFTAVTMLAELRGWDSETGLQRAVAFSEAVVGLRGATSADRDFYTPFLDRWERP